MTYAIRPSLFKRLSLRNLFERSAILFNLYIQPSHEIVINVACSNITNSDLVGKCHLQAGSYSQFSVSEVNILMCSIAEYFYV